MTIVVIPKEAVGMSLHDYLNQKGLVFSAPCGGKGTCGKCKVKVIDGRFASVFDPTQTIFPDEDGNLLACRAVCTKDGATVALSSDSIDGLAIEVTQGSEADQNGVFGVALDIGTTTLAAALVDKKANQILATASTLNPQSGFGGDVMSRIAASENGFLEAMQKVLLDEICRLIKTLLEKAGLAETSVVEEMTVVGNPTMLHIFCGVSPIGMGRYPFTPVFLDTKQYSGESLGLFCRSVTVLPSASSFIGSDVLGGALTERMLDKEEPSLLLDIGTNGEMLLCTGKKRGNLLYATSAAAGPAFEGANISCGMGGVTGAVSEILFGKNDTVPVFGTVDDAKPKGLCGSGLVDFAAYLLASGQMDETGYMEKESVTLMGYHKTHEGKRFTKTNVSVTDQDIRSLQLAKSAIRAAIETLVDYAGLSLAEIAATYLAGGLGYYINKSSAASIGLLPCELLPSSVSIGNSALAGAVWCLFHESGSSEMQMIANVCQTVELNDTVLFSELFMEHMMFPCEGEYGVKLP